MHTLTGAFPRKGIAMDTATEKVTPRQRHRLNQLLLSSVFTAEGSAPHSRMDGIAWGHKRTGKRSD